MRNPEKPKGRTIGVWLSGVDIEALDNRLRDTPHLREGTYGAEAIRVALRNEGYLKDTAPGQIAARALELAKVMGEDALRDALDRIATDHLAGASR